MHLDKNVHAKIMRRPRQAARLRVSNTGHNDQNAVRAIRAGLIDLVGIKQKVLAKTRQVRCLPCRDEIAETALKGGRIGEHRKACRASRLIGAGEGWRVEIGADQPFRRARLF